MVVDEQQAIGVVLGFGLLIVAWAHQHFHGQYRPKDIRFSVPQSRYFVALTMHVVAIATVYAIGVLFFYSSLAYHQCLTCDFTHISKLGMGSGHLKPSNLIWASLISALSLRILLPAFPATRHLLEQLRSLMHGLALFPTARDALVAAMAAQKSNMSIRGDVTLMTELASYGVEGGTIELLSPSAKRSLLEVYSLRQRLHEHVVTSEYRSISFSRWLTARASLQQETRDNTHQRRLAELFWRARTDELAKLEAEFQQLLRRSARALILVQDINAHFPKSPLCLAISGFVAEESEQVLVQYRRLVADLVLASKSERKERTEFLNWFGYMVLAPVSLPLRPWVIVFALDYLLFLIPALILLFTGGEFPVTPFILFASVHAISQTVALTWAICPKIVSNFARPSLYSLPWQSYVVYGIASFLTGGIILLIFRLNIPMPGEFPIGIPTLLSSFSFLLMTVGVSVLIDLWLVTKPTDDHRRQLRDGCVIALLMLAGTVTFQVVMFDIIGTVKPPRIIRIVFLTLSPSLGFIMGYFVPAAAAAYLEHANLRGPGLLAHQTLADAIIARDSHWQHSDTEHHSIPA